MKRFLPVFVSLTLAASAAAAQVPTDLPPEKGGTIYSLGMPPVYRGHAGAMIGWDRPGSNGEFSSLGHLGLMKALGSPVVGIMAVGLEGYAGYRANEFDWGGRALFSIPVFHVTTGVDYNGLESRFDWLVRLELPFRRGGIFGRGTQIRFDYLPTRGNSFGVGINSPLWGRNIGQTRPKTDNVRLRTPPLTRLDEGTYELPDGTREALMAVGESAHWITKLVMPFDDQKGGDPREVYAQTAADLNARFQTRSLNEEIAFYHAELDRVFSMRTVLRAIDPEVVINPSRSTSSRRSRPATCVPSATCLISTTRKIPSIYEDRILVARVDRGNPARTDR